MSFTAKRKPDEKTEQELESGTSQDRLYNRTSDIVEVKEGDFSYKRIRKA